MAESWELRVRRDDHSVVEIVETSLPEVGPGSALLKVDRVGVTANNITYAVLGEMMSYWNFFPTDDDGWGLVPHWGFADVVASEVEGIAVGERFYGYVPPAGHLLVHPERVGESGFRDASPHRAELPGAYQHYARTSVDPAYEADHEDLQILYRPLFLTSFLLDDFLADNDSFGAQTIVASSASSKTAYGTAFCHRERDERPRLIGLTSERNVPFTDSLGCYDEVVTYENVEKLDGDAKTVYEDFSGNAPLRERLHQLLGDSLVHDAIIGLTHFDAAGGSGADLPGAPPTMFFAPAQMKKRREDWGAGELERRFGNTWKRFVPTVEGWVEVVEGKGPEGLKAAWLEVLSGRSDPRSGNVIAL